MSWVLRNDSGVLGNILGVLITMFPWHKGRGQPNFCFSKSQECYWQDWYIYNWGTSFRNNVMNFPWVDGFQLVTDIHNMTCVFLIVYPEFQEYFVIDNTVSTQYKTQATHWLNVRCSEAWWCNFGDHFGDHFGYDLWIHVRKDLQSATSVLDYSEISSDMNSKIISEVISEIAPPGFHTDEHYRVCKG